MIETIKKLSRGDRSVANAFKEAQEFWRKFFKEHEQDGDAELAKAIDAAQSSFEHMLDMNRGFAKEIMPITCLAFLYDEINGFGDNRRLAERTVKAFGRSYVSLEVKSSMEDAARIFHVEHALEDY